MPAPHELTFLITVNSSLGATSGQRLFAVEIRRKEYLSQVQTFPTRERAEAYAAVIAKRLERLLEAGIELLD